MAESCIENFKELMLRYTGPQISIINQKISDLTAPGENYWSTMLKVDFTVKNEDTGKTEDIHAVAKCAHGLSDPKMLKLVAVPFQNEINFYGRILPCLRDFQDANGVKDVLDIFPKMYTARFNLTGESGKADKDTVLLLENLKYLGYSNVDRYIGFDYEGAMLILKDLAAFHAVPLAYKLKNRDAFETNIKAFCNRRSMGPPSAGSAAKRSPEIVWLEVLEEYENCRPYLPNLQKLLKGSITEMASRPAREPFSTLIHNDMWVNNTMQRDEDGKLVENKFLDFQMYFYESPTNDVVFFLFSSVHLQTLREYFDDLLKFYHNNFINVLKSFGCNVVPFGYDDFIEEVKYSLQLELMHAFIMSFVIFGEKGVAQEAGFEFRKKKEDISPIARDRAAFIVEELGRKGWI